MSSSQPRLTPLFGGSADEDRRADVIETLMPATVNIAIIKNKEGGAGSGFVYDSANGYIITNHHVVSGAEDIKIITSDERILSGTIIGSDKFTDIAVIKVDTKSPLPQAALGDSDKVRVGHDVIAIGAPMGLMGTVTTGIISAKDRDIGAGPYDQLLQHDASVNPGNSGGPLFNSAGQVVGVNAMIISRTGSSAGISLAIPINQAKWVADQIIANGAVRWGYLGASIAGITDDNFAQFKLTSAKGVVVKGFGLGSPAQLSGLRTGDVILAINGQDAQSPRFLSREIAKVTAGKQALLDIWRDGVTQTLMVTVGERPADAPSRRSLRQDSPETPPEGQDESSPFNGPRGLLPPRHLPRQMPRP